MPDTHPIAPSPDGSHVPKTDQGLSGATVLVTGGGRNIGRAIVHAFARRGAHVIINYFHSDDEARRTLAEVRDNGGSAELIRCTVGKRDAVHAMFDTIRERHGRLDILVNNAALGVDAPLEELTDDDWQRTLDVSLHGVRWCAEFAVPLMRTAPHPAIVNISSLYSRFPFDGYAAVGTCRGAVETLTRHLAARWASAGIRVNSVSPGIVDTTGLDGFPRVARTFRDRPSLIPLGRLGRPEDVAETVVFLASPAAGYITGQDLIVDGGHSLILPGLPTPDLDSRDTDDNQAPPPTRTHPRDRELPATAEDGSPAVNGAGPAVAVVGMGVVTPGANSPDELWDVLTGSNNVFGEPERFSLRAWSSDDPDAEDKTTVIRAGNIREFRPHPRLASEVASGDPQWQDPTVQFLRHCLLQAMDTVTRRPDDRCGVYVVTAAQVGQALEETILRTAAVHALAGGAGGDRAAMARLRALLREHYPYTARRCRHALPDSVIRAAFVGLLPDDTDWLVPDTACSSGLYSIDWGVKALLAGDCDIAFCGGAITGNRREAVLSYKASVLPRTGEVRAYDHDACGVVLSEAAAIVALKRLDLAEADGDRVLGVISGFGCSVDGAGSVVAPDPAGQSLAIRRARHAGGIAAPDVDWIIGHGTGTKIGDVVELEALTGLSTDAVPLLTSNKSLVGHTAWVAGTVSVVHALLALRHDTIPGQRYFRELPPGIASDKIDVPVTDTPWPKRTHAPRTVGVSAFGLGGTNAHLHVHDRPPGPTRRPFTTDNAEDVVLVGWSTYLPGEPDEDQVLAWLRGDGPPPPRSFGERYPIPPLTQVKMPPITARSIDRTHLMAITAADRLATRHGQLWEDHRDTTGVITGHAGPPRSLTEYTIRLATDDLTTTLTDDAVGFDTAPLHQYLDELKRRVPPANEDAFFGEITNVISSRIANRYHLRGMAMSVDAGRASTHAALHVAHRYLTTRQLDLALVLGINGNSTPINAALFEVRSDGLGEGAVLMALTRRTTAVEHGWDVLAQVETHPITRTPPPARHHLDWDTNSRPSYLGAEEALTLLQALTTNHHHIDIRSTDPGPHITLKREATTPPPPDRTVITLRRADSQPSDAKPAAIAPGGVVLVDSADVACALAARARQASTVILSTDPTTRVDGVIVLGAAENALPDSVRRRLAGAAPHLRVVASACTPQHRWPAPPPEASVRAQEWLVPILRELAPTGDTGSVAALLLTPPLGPHVHPHLALISGFLRSLAHEADYPVLAVVTDATLEDGLDELAAEPFPSPDGTVVHYRRSARYVEQVCPAALPAPAADAPLRVGGEPVVVATGGARGATAAVLTGLARRTRPKLWLLGTTELEPVPSELLDCDEQDVPKVRAGFIRDCRNSRPGTTVAEANRRFDRLLRVREITRNLNRFKQLCGTDRVRYLLCDVTDPDQVGRVARQVYDEDGRVDLLVHGAGRIHSDPVEDKQLGWFRAVRDPKVAGYHNLKTAFRSRPPAVWCNFGSGSGLLGMAGDTDYSPANEYLAAAASYGHVLGRRDEFTIHWPLWTETGMARNQVDLLRQRFGTAAGLTNEQGAAVFLGELARNRPPGTVAVYGLRQGMIPGRHNVTATPDPGSDTVPLLARRTGDRAADPTWVWRPVLPRDRYLLEHVVDGRVIAPAVIMLALCAEAARQVEPAARVVGFRDVVIEEALHFDPRGGEQQFRVTATTGAGGVVVRILSDVVARDGRVLRSDREHLRTEVLLSDTVTAPPRWRASPPPPATPVVQNSATRADSPLHLSGVFETVHDITANGDAVHARWIARVGNDDVLTGLPIPALLIDGLGQLLLHRLDGTQTLPVGVPVGFGRIDLHTTGSDAEVVSRYPCGLDLHFDATADTLSAVSPTGEVLVRITGARIHRFPAIPLRPAEPSTPLAGDR